MDDARQQLLHQLIIHWGAECVRIGYGKCSSRRCLVRGGYAGGPPDFDRATCEALETIKFLRELT